MIVCACVCMCVVFLVFFRHRIFVATNTVFFVAIPPVTNLGDRVCCNHNVSRFVCAALSRRHFLNRSSFCNQIWYGGASSWDEVSCKNN